MPRRLSFEVETSRWSSVKLLTQYVEKERCRAELAARDAVKMIAVVMQSASSNGTNCDGLTRTECTDVRYALGC